LTNASSQPLPFTPPVEGCQVEKIHHVGPFITRVDLTLPNGKPWTWNSRQHRFAGTRQAAAAAQENRDLRERWWLKVGLFARVIWWVAALFMVGASCFAVASWAGLAPGLFGAFAASVLEVNLVFFLGSIFFTSAAYLQLLGAVNANRLSAIASRRIPQEPFRWFAWRAGEIGWASAFIQFVGTVLFNVNTFDALLPDLDWLQEDLLIWTPDVAGSICFLVASGLALVEYGGRLVSWQPGDVSWWIVSINMLGSVAFGVSAVYAVVLPDSADLLDAWAVNLWTLLGAICFLVGAYLLLPELRRNLARLVANVPSE
jgi:hypothetical protein